ncbi:MAG: hypothetical protein KJ893_00885 [Candidatus Omnitrophica bacterium]|nr:hypothetical protein [Candidatus Omnitrophota bacterium]MBU4478166.1 hypothetical protein [Candidatus Omnitrophota bacterium]MCG2703087.1 hypothetical protein [Candidatus Omnitrophota bacterium]
MHRLSRFKQALALKEKILGYKHPALESLLENLIVYYKQMGKSRLVRELEDRMKTLKGIAPSYTQVE